MNTRHRQTFSAKSIIYLGMTAIMVTLLLLGARQLQGAVVNQNHDSVDDVTYSDDGKNMSIEKDYANQKSMPKDGDSKRTPASFDGPEQRMERSMEYHEKEYLYDRKYK